MAFQGREFTQGMKQLVVNLKRFNDVERFKNEQKALWSIVQTAEGLDIGEATVRRIMAEYNKNKQNVPADSPKARGRPDFTIPSGIQPVVRRYTQPELERPTCFC